MPVVPFSPQQQRAEPQGPQPDDNFVLMAAGMMHREGQDEIREQNDSMNKAPNPYMNMDTSELLNELRKEMVKQGRRSLTIQGLKGTPEGEFKTPKDYSIEDEPKSPYNDAEALRNSLMKRSPKERRI